MSMHDEQLPAISDSQWSRWLDTQFEKACNKEHRWKTHMDTTHGVHEHQKAVRMKRCIREAAAFEAQANEFADTVHRISNLMGKAMDRNEITPSVYQALMTELHKHQESIRRTKL